MNDIASIRKMRFLWSFESDTSAGVAGLTAGMSLSAECFLVGNKTIVTAENAKFVQSSQREMQPMLVFQIRCCSAAESHRKFPARANTPHNYRTDVSKCVG